MADDADLAQDFEERLIAEAIYKVKSWLETAPANGFAWLATM